MENYQNLIDDLSINHNEWKIEDNVLTRMVKDGIWEHTYRIRNATESPRVSLRSENKDNYKQTFSHDIRPGFFDRQKIVAAVKIWRSLFVFNAFTRLGKKVEV